MAAVDRLVGEVMSQEPYKSARRVFWITDNCSVDRGQKAHPQRLPLPGRTRTAPPGFPLPL